MKLEKFETNKNKKKKAYITMAIVGVLLITVFVLYRSYALYQEEKTYNVLNGVIPDFNGSDIQLAFTINGKASNSAFPNKSDGYTVNSVTCQNGVDASWNSDSWGLSINNSNNNSKISCTIDFKSPICKRATSLHTEICESDDFGCVGIHGNDPHTKGDTITYGSLGTKGSLATGDAFDCDVNGDGVYDSETERFYYVNDLEGYNDTAILIYYNNYGEETTYDNSGNHSTNDSGPSEAVKQLPTSNEWSNIKLKNPIRNITNDDGNILKNNFDYSGYAARLLSAKEIGNSCGITIRDGGAIPLPKCEFLLENMNYKLGPSSDIYEYWLEDLNSFESLPYMVQGNNYSISQDYADMRFYVRPLIEINKSDIDY